MNREIIEAIKQIEREKGISSEILLVALEDALLAAYRKTAGACEWARVDIDRETGDMQVSQLVLAEGRELVTLPRPEPEVPEGVDPRSLSRRRRTLTGPRTVRTRSSRSASQRSISVALRPRRRSRLCCSASARPSAR